jgi:glyoxylase-like metal-dependent hydrolase (beta-lactamase superfamily II)/8-oxo-dGTP pyrophosphatase MutT (NUDIX family)
MNSIRREKLLHGWRDPVAPRSAATILLLRDHDDGLQVLMTRRSETASFAPGVYVFPGGAVDAADAGEAAHSVSRARADQDADHRQHAHAALRESFEELGILLAWRKGQQSLCEPHQTSALDRSQNADFYAQLANHQLELAIDRTGWLSQWTTDPDLPKRFQVRFFVAPMPPGQEPVADGTEQFEPVWINPAQALTRHEQGAFKMIFPTIRTLGQLKRYERVDQVIDSCQSSTKVYFANPRGGLVKGKEARFTEDETQFGEVAMVAPDGKMVHALDWRHDAPVPLRTNVQRLTAPNAGMMTGPGTNTYIVGEAGQFVVIDPGPDLPDHIERIANVVGDGLQAIICTHSHPDHSPGAPLLREAVGKAVPILGLKSLPTARANSSFTPDRELAHGERITVGDSTLRAVHTPGHAANHVCLVLEEDRLLFSGDHVLNGSTTVVDPPDGNMFDYIASLKVLAQEPVDFILPAHGYVLGSAKQAIEKLMAHRLGREAKVAAALSKTGGGTLDDIVPVAYDDVNSALFPIAKRSLLAHLEKLVTDGKASVNDGRWAPA